MNYEARVAKGAAELDRILPGWERRIDLDDLNLASGCKCILGQMAVHLVGHETYDGYEEAIDLLYPAKFYTQTLWAFDRGFAFVEPQDVFTAPCDWEGLTEAWKRLIRQRLEAGS